MEKLSEFNIEKNPLETFKKWHMEAKKSEINADAFSFATAENDELSVRYLLFKGFYEDKFKIFGSEYSKKAKHLSQNTKAAMAFFWPQSMLQIRIEGQVEEMPRTLVNEYFQTRPFESQVASTVSKQSTPLKSREEMLEQFNRLKETSEPGDLKVPDFWKGWLFNPNSFEFFIYREHRLNDRFLFEKDNQSNEYHIQRIWP